MLLSELPTPQVLVDHERARRNIDRVQALASAAGVRLRPHAKTHKSPRVAAWQIAYSEIWVTETLWPDFRRRDLLEAVLAYQKRDRRYGGIKQSPVALGAK